MPLANAQDYPIWSNALIFIVAATAVWLAGSGLARYVDGIARKTRMGSAFAGMLLLGGITSLPEIATVFTSSWIGNPALAVNNLLGSAAINVLLLAIADALIGRDAITSVVAKPATLMQSGLCMLVLVMVAVAIVSGDIPVFGVGLWAVGLFAASIAAFWIAASYERRAPWAIVEGDASERRDPANANAAGAASLRSLAFKTILAGIVVLVAGYSLAQTGDALAKQTGIGTGMAGFVLIGISTSMPELSSITAAIRIRRYEMAIGEVLGTNFVNLSLILVADIVYSGGPVINELGRFETLSALLGALVTGLYLVGLLEHRNPTVLRMGYDSLAIMVVFAGGLVLLYAAG